MLGAALLYFAMLAGVLAFFEGGTRSFKFSPLDAVAPTHAPHPTCAGLSPRSAQRTSFSRNRFDVIAP